MMTKINSYVSIIEKLWKVEYTFIVLFSSLPIVNFVSFNVDETGFCLYRSFFYLFSLIVFSYISVQLISVLFRVNSRVYVAVFVGLVICITFNGNVIDNIVFGDFFENIGINPRLRYIVIIYFCLVIVCAGLAYVLTDRRKFVPVLIVGLLSFILFDMFKIISVATDMDWGKGEQVVDIKSSASVNTNELKVTYDIARNVYFILPDMMFGEALFARFDIKRDILNGFRKRGFYLANNAYSNAPVTRFSLPHIFSMEYNLKHGEKINRKRIMNEISGRFGKGNTVYNNFKERNYKIYALNDGYWGNCGRGEDACLYRNEKHTHEEQDLRFLERTPFIRILQLIDITYQLFDVPMNIWAYPNRLEVPELIDLLPNAASGPFFTYIHIMLPHYPLRFDKDCHYKYDSDVVRAYGAQYVCAVKYLELLIDEIENNDKNAIIVIHSDHGVSFSKQHLKQVDELSAEEIEENLSIFSAFKLPQHCEKHLYDSISPVNTFRLIFACLDNRTPDLLEDKSFLVYYPKWPSGGKVREWRRQQ